MRKIDRFDKYMSFKGLNDNRVTVELGLSVGVIGKSRKAGRDLSTSVVEQILNFYKDLNRVWLITGDGEMLLKTEPKAEQTAEQTGVLAKNPNEVYLLPVSAQAGSLNDFVTSVKKDDCEKIISPIYDVDFAITVSGDSMAPEYPNGSRIFIKKIDEKAFIEWGKVYVLDTCNGTVVKRLVPAENDDRNKVRCLSINPDPIYAPFEIDLKDVFGIYKVLLCMSIK